MRRRHRRRRGGHGTLGGIPKRSGQFHSGGRRWPKRLVIGVVSLVILLVVLAGGGWFYLNYRLGNIPRLSLPAHLLAPTSGGGPFDVLFVGPEEGAGSGAGAGAGGDDMIVVARFVPADHGLALLSIPGALSVPAAGHPGVPGTDTLAAAYQRGPAVLVRAVENDLHIPVAHLVEVGTAGMPGLIDAFGGIQLDFPMPLEDPKSGLAITATGCQAVDASKAAQLFASDSPYYFEEGSWHKEPLPALGKVRQQAAMLSSLFARAQGQLGDPLRFNGLVGTAAGHLRIDSTWTTGELISLGRQMQAVPAASLWSPSLPAAGGAGVMAQVQPADRDLIATFVAYGTASGGPTTTVKPGAPAGGQSGAEPWDPFPCSA